jgi:hypothetical protein
LAPVPPPSKSITYETKAETDHFFVKFLQQKLTHRADIYSYTLDGQWIDTTGVPAGTYTLRVTINPSGIVNETDYSDNTAITTGIVITSSTCPGPAPPSSPGPTSPSPPPPTPSTCTVLGQTCTSGSNCCSGGCTSSKCTCKVKNNGCTAHHECCSKKCTRYKCSGNDLTDAVGNPV